VRDSPAFSTQLDQLRQKRTANSRANQACGLFVPKALASYRDLGLYDPAMETFTRDYLTHKFSRLPACNYNPPAETIIQETLTAWEQLEDRDLFLAIGHELAFGLRAGELAQAKWDWHQTRQGYPVLDGEAHVKNGTGRVQVRALDPFYTILTTRAKSRGWIPSLGSTGDSPVSLGDSPKPSSYIISGTLTARSDAIFRAVSDFLRQHGWQTQKTNHALRAYAGSQIAMKYGIYEASTWLRHSTVKVTESHYTHFINKFRPQNPDALPVRWATGAIAAPQLLLAVA
jgi:integrase